MEIQRSQNDSNFLKYSCAILTVAQRGGAVSTLLKSHELMHLKLKDGVVTFVPL